MTPTDSTTPTPRNPYRRLLDAEARFVLCFRDKRAMKLDWQTIEEPAENVRAHVITGGMVGIIPASVGLLVVDVDDRPAIGPNIEKREQAAVKACGEPLARYVTRGKGGVHLLYRAPEAGYGNKAWRYGELRCSNGYAIPWDVEAWIRAMGEATVATAPDPAKLPPKAGKPPEPVAENATQSGSSGSSGSPGGKATTPADLAAMGKDEGRQDAFNAGVYADARAGRMTPHRMLEWVKAADTCGLVEEDGAASVNATIASALKGATGKPKPKPAKPKPAGVAVSFEPVKPAESPQPLADILAALVSNIRRFMHLPAGAAETIACWCAWTYVSEHSYILPYLALTSPIKGCGKTTLLDVLERFILKPNRSSTTTEAALFRLIEASSPTLLLDEADQWMTGHDEMSKALTAVVNDGYRRGGGVLRCVKVDGDWQSRVFPTDCPKAFAGIGDYMKDATADRSITIVLEKPPPGIPLEDFRADRPLAPELRGLLQRWADDYGDDFAAHDPDTAGLRNREADNWRPLFTIGDLAGGNWPRAIRGAVSPLRARAAGRGDAKTPQERLVTDAYAVFEAAPIAWMLTEDFDKALRDMPDSPYLEWRRGKPITAQSRGRLLAKFGIFAEGPAGGRFYGRSAFEATWASLDIPPVEPVEPVEPDSAGPTQSGSTGSTGSDRGKADPPSVPVEEPPLVMNPRQPHVDHVTDMGSPFDPKEAEMEKHDGGYVEVTGELVDELAAQSAKLWPNDPGIQAWILEAPGRVVVSSSILAKLDASRAES